jgi:hypothetical protein
MKQRLAISGWLLANAKNLLVKQLLAISGWLLANAKNFMKPAVSQRKDSSKLALQLLAGTPAFAGSR